MEKSATPGSSTGSTAESSDSGKKAGTELTNGKDSDQKSNTGDVPAGAKQSESGSLKEAAKAALKRIKIGSVEGDVQEELAEAIKNLERGLQLKYQQNAKANSEFQADKDLFMRDPDAYFRKQGMDPDQYAQQKIAKRLERELMTDEQRELVDTKAKLMQFEKERQEATDRENMSRQEIEEQKFAIQTRKEMMTAWEQSGLPADAKFGQWMAATMLAANNQNLNWTWEDCANKVKDDVTGQLKDMATKLGPERLHEFLGDDLLNSWRKHDLKRVTSMAANKTTATQKSPANSAASGTKKKPLNEKSWDKAWDNL